jgi:hypothetical protein
MRLFPWLTGAKPNETRGNPFGQATYITDTGLVTGFVTASDGTSHAVVWDRGLITDISKPGLGGPNSELAAPTFSVRF